MTRLLSAPSGPMRISTSHMQSVIVTLHDASSNVSITFLKRTYMKLPTPVGLKPEIDSTSLRRCLLIMRTSTKYYAFMSMLAMEFYSRGCSLYSWIHLTSAINSTGVSPLSILFDDGVTCFQTRTTWLSSRVAVSCNGLNMITHPS